MRLLIDGMCYRRRVVKRRQRLQSSVRKYANRAGETTAVHARRKVLAHRCVVLKIGSEWLIELPLEFPGVALRLPWQDSCWAKKLGSAGFLGPNGLYGEINPKISWKGKNIRRKPNGEKYTHSRGNINLDHSYLMKEVCWFCCGGCISPEYALNGEFSKKSDVFSFGVLLLEILPRKANAVSLFNNEITSFDIGKQYYCNSWNIMGQDTFTRDDCKWSWEFFRNTFFLIFHRKLICALSNVRRWC
ncbi:Serine-threonine/tyrosine-protein kinase, catalytic domain [Dillenia turbinata]|uniref:Serine-threonine/tyrosine-protein kinase, catalytic domain n=1 Tax=Dillenia turbinata TaxID=194707 RepID=A0AAN8UXY5_9MAGN